MATRTIKDHNGLNIPIKLVPKLDMQKHKAVERLMKKAKALNKKLVEFKQEALKINDELYQKALEEYGVVGQNKGGYSNTTFDKELKIEVKISNKIEFDDKIKIAQQLITEYLEELTNGASPALVTITTHAFTTTRGKLDTKRVTDLFSFKISHPKWKKAMDIIRDSMTSNHSKRYMNFWERDNEGKYQPISLQFSNL